MLMDYGLWTIDEGCDGCSMDKKIGRRNGDFDDLDILGLR